MDSFAPLVDLLRSSSRVVGFTGAGVSTESGIPDFRSPGGVWTRYDPRNFEFDRYVEDAAVRRLSWEMRREFFAAGATPNPAHRALARLEAALGDDLLVVTQNIDDLHERAGSTRVLHMHGALRSALCTACGTRVEWDGALGDLPPCPVCHHTALRPDVVWFGEIPYEMDRILAALEGADLFVSIGTSGAVYPAAGFVQQAKSHGARAIELNLERSQGSQWFDETRLGPASERVPEWVDEVLGK